MPRGLTHSTSYGTELEIIASSEPDGALLFGSVFLGKQENRIGWLLLQASFFSATIILMKSSSLTLDYHQKHHLAIMFREGANLIMAAVIIAGLVEKTAPPNLMVIVLAGYILVVAATTQLQKGG